MPKIPEVRTAADFNARMLELIQETSSVLESAVALSIDKRRTDVQKKKEVTKDLEALCTEVKDAATTFEGLSPDSASAEALGRDLLRDVTAKLTQSRKLMGLGKGSGMGAFERVASTAEMTPLVAAYKQDTRQDGVWGGELEANLGALYLGFQCNIYVVSGEVVKRRLRVGAGAPSRYHLLHKGNHYEVVRDFSQGVMDIPEDREFAWCYVIPTARDGNCLYHALLEIHFQRTHMRNIPVAQLRREVANQFQDEMVEAAVIGILQGGDVGVGSLLSAELEKRGSFSVDFEEYKKVTKGKSLSACRTWTSLGEMGKKDYFAQISSLEDALELPPLAATLRRRHGEEVETGGTYFAAWALRRTGTRSKAYTVEAEPVGTNEYKSDGMTPNPNGHAEGHWFAEANEPPRATSGGGKKGSTPGATKGSMLEEVAKDRDIVALVCHDSKAPCTDICTSRLYVLAGLLGKPILVYGYSDWGHIQSGMHKTLQAFLDDGSDEVFSGQKIASSKLGPVLLFMSKGIFLVGLCDKDNTFFFPAPSRG